MSPGCLHPHKHEFNLEKQGILHGNRSIGGIAYEEMVETVVASSLVSYFQAGAQVAPIPANPSAGQAAAYRSGIALLGAARLPAVHTCR